MDFDKECAHMWIPLCKLSSCSILLAYLMIADCSKLSALSLRTLSIWSLEKTPLCIRQFMLIWVQRFCCWLLPGRFSWAGTGPPLSLCGLWGIGLTFCSVSGMRFTICSFYVYLSALDSRRFPYVCAWSRNRLEVLGCRSRRSGPVAFSFALATLYNALGFKDVIDADRAILSWKNWSCALLTHLRYSSKSTINRADSRKLSAFFNYLLNISLTINLNPGYLSCSRSKKWYTYPSDGVICAAFCWRRLSSLF